MGKIHVLDTELSNKIAAGEVVERPASVIKELVENSIDAGSTSITVEIRDGGVTYMRVTDNGSGMKREDAEIAFLRHATSKIQSADDLDAIYTLGFRGEALSSIAAVSRTDLYTKTADTDEGVHVHAEGGEITLSDSAGTPTGTTIVVNNLFFNTPARMKFLKKNSTEGGYISDIISRFILAHPEISFKFINGKKEQLFSSGNNNLVDCIYTVYGKDYAKSSIAVDYTHNNVRVSGAVGKGEVSRPNRNFQSFFINGRYIKSPLIMRAVEEAYKNQVMIGKFPMAILNIEINPSMIDINVHPTKLEVKFSDERLIYEAIYWGVKNALYQTVQIPKIESKQDTKTIFDTSKEKLFEQGKFEPAKPNVIVPPKNQPQIVVDEETGEILSAPPKEEVPKEVVEDIPPKKVEYYSIETDAPKPDITKLNIPQEPVAVKQEQTEYIVDTEERPVQEVQAEAPAQEISANRELLEEYKLVGQVFDTYIIAQHNDNMLIIDQHAAHERLKYEELKKNLADGTVTPQILLIPTVVTMSATEYSTFNANRDFFYNIGFETDDFGENSIIVRSAPMDMDDQTMSELIIELIAQLDGSKRELITAKEDRALYTIACKAAIKANHALHTDEMKKLLNAVFSLPNINTCPHGRPIIVSMSKKELEKDFKRIV